MNSHTAIKILLRRAHLNRHPETLQHLPAPQAQNMQSDNLLLGPRTNKLVARRPPFRLLDDGIIHRRKARIVHLDILIPILLPRLGLRKPDSAHLRVREHDGWDIGVVELRGAEL